MKKVRFAVIGCGNIGTRHLAVLDSEEKAEIVSICDIDEDKCVRLSDLYGGVPYFANYAAIFDNREVDVVNICTPHDFHAQMAIDAANAGCHVLVEKPMSLTTSSASSMIEASIRNNVRLMVVKQNRYNVPIVLTKKALDANKLGRVFMVRCDVLWNRNEEYYEESGWRGKKASEGGALYTQASHFIDLLIWWFGDVVSATSRISTKNHSIEIEDCGSALLEFNSGVMGTLLWTTCVYNKNYEGSITIIGEKGTIKIGGQYLNRIDYWDVRGYPLPENINYVDKPNLYAKYQGSSSNHDKVIADVIAHINNRKNGIVVGDEGIKSVRAIEMIYNNAVVAT